MALIPDGKGGFTFTGVTPQNQGPIGVKPTTPGMPTTGNITLPKQMVNKVQTPPPTATKGTETGSGVNMANNPYSFENYYKAHPNANPANNPSSTPPTSATSSTTPPATYPAPQNFDPNQQGLYGALIAALANRAQQPTPDYLAQQAEANKYNEALKQSRINEAGQLAANAQNPIPLEFQQGRGQVIQGQYAQEQAALGAGYQGAANLLGQANVQQGLQQQGLGTAISATAPQPYGITTTPFNPATGTFGTMPGGQGGAFGAGGVEGNVELGRQYTQVMLPAYNQAGTIKQDFEKFLDQNPTVNQFTSNVANAAQQWLQGKQLSDPNQIKLGQFLTEFTNTLAPIVGSSGSVTNFKQDLVNGLTDITARGGSLKEAIQNMYDIAGKKLADIYRTGTGKSSTGTANDPLGIR